MRRRANGEGSVYKRADGRWAGTVELGREGGKRKRKTVYGRTKQEVIKKRRAAQHEVDVGMPVPDDRQTLESFLNRWVRLVVEPSDLAASTKASYADNVRIHLVPDLGRIRLTKLAPHDLQQFMIRKREAGYSARTVQYLVAILRAGLAQALRWGEVSRNVATLVRAPSPSSSAVDRALTPVEVHRLLEVADGDPLYAFIVVLLATGIRKGEALALRWTDVDLKSGSLKVERTIQRIRGQGLVVSSPKTRGSRGTLQLAPQVVSVLLAHRRKQMKQRLQVGALWRDEGLVFASSSGTAIDPRNINRRFGALCEEAGLPPKRVHDLRHTAATLAFAAGLDTRTVQEMLRHTRIATTADIYVQVPIALRRNAATRVAEGVFGEGSQAP